MRFTNAMAILLALIAMSTLASAAISTLTISAPASGEILYPNMGDPYMDVTFTGFDDVNAPIHTIVIKLDDGDTNRTLFSDTNMGPTNCAITYDEEGKAGGTQYVCTLRYTFPTTQGEIFNTGNYQVDLNFAAYNQSGDINSLRTETQTIMIDNRYISAAVQTVSLLLPVILFLAAIVGILLEMYGVISGPKVSAIVIGLIVLVIASIVIAIGLGILTP